MTAWLWVLCILIALFLLTLAKLRVVVRYEQGLFLEIRYLFLKRSYPSKRQKRPKQERPEQAQSKPPKHKEDGGIRDEQSFRERVGHLLDMVQQAFMFSRKLLAFVKKKLLCEKLALRVQLGLGDAALTALSVGSLWAFLYTSYATLERFFTVTFQQPEFDISPDYQQEHFDFQFYGIFSIRVVNIIITGTWSLVYYLLRFKQKKQEG